MQIYLFKDDNPATNLANNGLPLLLQVTFPPSIVWWATLYKCHFSSIYGLESLITSFENSWWRIKNNFIIKFLIFLSELIQKTKEEREPLKMFRLLLKQVCSGYATPFFFQKQNTPLQTLFIKKVFMRKNICLLELFFCRDLFFTVEGSTTLKQDIFLLPPVSILKSYRYFGNSLAHKRSKLHKFKLRRSLLLIVWEITVLYNSCTATYRYSIA